MKRWKKRTLKLLYAALSVFLLCVVCVVGYLHFVGLPGWAQLRLFGELERSGLTVVCDRLWLDFRRGVVAENVSLGFQGGTEAYGSAKELILGLRPTNLLWGRQVVESLRLREAKFSASVPHSDAIFRVEGATARARIGSDGAIDLDDLTAEVMGIKLTARGYLLPRTRGAMPRQPLKSRADVVPRIVQALQETKFVQLPSLHVDFAGDLSDPQKSSVRVEFLCGAATYEEWSVESLWVTARLEKEEIGIENFRVEALGGVIEGGGRYDLGSGAYEARVKSSANVLRAVKFLPQPLQEKVKEVQLSRPPQWEARVWTEALAPRVPFVEGRVTLEDFVLRTVPFKHVSGKVVLAGQKVKATDVRVAMGKGEARGEYEEDFSTRTFAAKAESTLDATLLAPMLLPRHQEFLGFFKVTDSLPQVAGEAHGQWTKPETIAVTAKVALKNFEFRKIALSDFAADLKIENEVCTLSNAVGKRPEGTGRGTYTAGIRNHQYAVELETEMDPHCLKPVLSSDANKFLDQFVFAKPPRIVGKMSGDFRNIREMKFDGTVTSGSFTLNGVMFTGSAATLAHAQERVRFVDLRLTREVGVLHGEGVYDFSQRQAVIKGISTVNAHETAAVFGPTTVAAIEPYQFDAPPRLEAEGLLDFREPMKTNLRVKIAGEKFHYWKFDADVVSTDLAMKDGVLSLTNFTAKIYRGNLEGAVRFELGKTPIPFSGDVRVRKADLRPIVKALTGKPTEVKGELTGKMNFAATSKGPETIEGYGSAHVEDGVIWDVPVFGAVSKAMGILHSKPSRAQMTFVASAGKLQTEDLVVDGGSSRLTLRGNFGLNDMGLDFRAQVHLMGATPLPVLGWIFNPFTKALEMHVGGKLNEPHLRPLWLPKELFFFLP